MRVPPLLLVLLALSAGGYAQSSPAADVPATSVEKPAESSAAKPTESPVGKPAESSVAKPSETTEKPAETSAGKPSGANSVSAPPVSQKNAPSGADGAKASPSIRLDVPPSDGITAAGKPAATTVAKPSGQNSNPPKQNSQQPAASSVPPPNGIVSNSVQGTQGQSESPRASVAVVSTEGSGGTKTAATEASGTRGAGGSSGTASAGSYVFCPNSSCSPINISRSGTGDGDAGLATGSVSAPGLATTASFAAQPSDNFKIVDETSVKDVPESNTPTPPDTASTDQFNAELTANIPDKAISNQNAKSLAILETAYFEYFVNKDPAPVDIGKVFIPSSISQCQNLYSRRLVKRKGFVDNVMEWMPLVSRDLRGFNNCKAVDSLEVGVYFHYMRASATAARPNELETRVQAQVNLLNEALGAVKINFKFMALNWWEPKASEDWTSVSRRETKLQEWQRRTRAPGKLMLTVWIVNALRSNDKDKQDLNSYATFPNEVLDEDDGIVIEEAHVQGGNSTTLIHDVGHWFGLGHTFAEVGQQCVAQSGLTNATQTSGNQDVLYQCSQVTCAGGPSVDINNYMSYSSCRGKIPEQGFTTDQKARMFANALQFRRGYETGECTPDGKAAVRKRSSMQDLLDGNCPDVDKQANILVNTPHTSVAALYKLPNALYTAVVAGWTFMLLLI